MKYDFSTQHKIGQEGEDFVKKHFEKEWIINSSSLQEQKQGIDFHFLHRKNGQHCTVEIKSDTRASQTGNAFVETYSSYPDKLGWAHTCQADYLFYCLPKELLIYIFRPAKLREVLKSWEKYPKRDIQNKGWISQGLLVPLPEFKSHASRVLTL